MATVQVDINGLKTDVAVMKIDILGMTTDITLVKTEITAVKTDTLAIKTDMTKVRSNVEGMAASMADHVSTPYTSLIAVPNKPSLPTNDSLKSKKSAHIEP